MSRLEIAIAWRYLRSRRGSKLLSLISLIAIGGVIIGVSALIVVIGVMNGLQNDLRAKILIGSPDLRVLTYSDDMVMDNWQGVLAKVARQRGVKAVAPFVLTQSLVRHQGHGYQEPAFVLGILPQSDTTPEVTTIRRTAKAGDFTFRSPDGLRRGAVVGRALAQRIGVTPGVDSISLLTAKGGIRQTAINPVTGMPTPLIVTLPVTGIFETGMYEYDNNYVVVSLEVGQEVASLGNDVTGLEVLTPTRDQASAVAADLQLTLGYPYRTESWEQQNHQLFTALNLEKAGMGLILFLIVLVAAFNIVSTLTMVVADKTREIGILRAIGMRASSIRRIFFAQGMTIGVFGTLTGLVIGLIASYVIQAGKLISLDPSVYFIDHLPVSTQPRDVVLIVLASLGVAAAATLYPARLAARLYPVEAIRHE